MTKRVFQVLERMPARTAVPHLLMWLKSPRSGVDVTAASNALGALCACVGDVGGGEGVCISGHFRVRMFMDRVPRAVEGQVCAAVSFSKYSADVCLYDFMCIYCAGGGQDTRLDPVVLNLPVALRE